MREIRESDGWVVREILDTESATRYTQYFFRRKRAPRIHLTSKLAQQLAGYALIDKDLRSFIVWLEEIERLNPPEKFQNKGAQISSNRAIFNLVKGLYMQPLLHTESALRNAQGES